MNTIERNFQAIKDGATEYVVRNFDADHGRVYDLYSYIGGRVVNHGMVHEEYGYGSTAYRTDEHNKSIPLNDKALYVEHAKLLLLHEIEVSDE